MGARLSSALGRHETAIDERHRPHALSIGGGPAATPPEALVPTSSPRAAPPRSWSSSPVRGSAAPRSSSSSPVRGGLDARLRQLSAEWATEDISEVLPNRLYIGTSAAAESLTLLRGLRIGGLVNCTENPNEPCADRVDYLVIPVDDQPHINIGRHFDAAAEWLASQQQRSACLVYCGRGVSRSAAVVLAALMKLEGMTLLDAWLRLKRARPRVRPNPGFLKQVRDSHSARTYEVAARRSPPL